MGKITVFISPSNTIPSKVENYTPDQVAIVTPGSLVADFIFNRDYLVKVKKAQVVIVEDAHLIFPKRDFKLKVILEFLELQMELWLLVPDQHLLHDLMLESVSRIQDVSIGINNRLVYDNSLSWVTDDLALGLSRGQNYIFWGESGVGKTTMALELAKAMNAQVVRSRCFDLVHGSVGESEKELGNLFKKAKDSQPAVLVLDDLDTLFKKRGHSGDLALKMVTQLILELDEIQFNRLSVIFLGTAINILDLDESLWKGGRCNPYHVKKSN